MRTLLCLFTLCACTVDEPASMPWSELRNPVMEREDAVKDAFAVFADGAWHLGYSFIDDEPFRFRIGLSQTRDWQRFDHLSPLDDPAVGGLASPDVARAPDGRWVMTYNSHTRDVGDSRNKLYYRTSTDLLTWSEGKRIRVEGVDGPEERLIDAALAFAEAGVFLFFKRDQVAHVAWSPSGDLDAAFTLLGALEPAQLENFQVLRLDGVWHLLGTTIPFFHHPLLLRLDGDERVPQAWRTWTRVRELEIPEQGWNSGGGELFYERSNAGYLIDHRPEDGRFYLLYAGSTELTRYEGRGYSRLGLARSHDLVDWEVPPAR